MSEFGQKDENIFLQRDLKLHDSESIISAKTLISGWSAVSV